MNEEKLVFKEDSHPFDHFFTTCKQKNQYYKKDIDLRPCRGKTDINYN